MSFAENLKQVRKEKGLSQEELADLLHVSRQAVSKWEQNQGFPEVEKLLVLAREMNISLDSLMADEMMKKDDDTHDVETTPASGRILIASYDHKSIANCYKITSSKKFKTKDDEPKFALFGVDGHSFWGDNTIILGWYENEESIQKEMQCILQAMKRGMPTYELQYAVHTKQHLWKIKIDKEQTTE